MGLFENSQIEQRCKTAEEAAKEALQSLGKMYFEANQDNAEAAFSGQIATVKECLEKEKLWRLYRLRQQSKTQCDKCGAIIDGDSAFCNKCGAVIEPKDFSIIGITLTEPNTQTTSGVCPSCGSQLVSGAIFCEKCGCKVGGAL